MSRNEYTTIGFDKSKYRKFNKIYHNARKKGVSKFVFENTNVLTDYAELVLLYLRNIGMGGD
jgi:hypothetical protein